MRVGSYKRPAVLCHSSSWRHVWPYICACSPCSPGCQPVGGRMLAADRAKPAPQPPAPAANLPPYSSPAQTLTLHPVLRPACRRGVHPHHHQILCLRRRCAGGKPPAVILPALHGKPCSIVRALVQPLGALGGGLQHRGRRRVGAAAPRQDGLLPLLGLQKRPYRGLSPLNGVQKRAGAWGLRRTGLKRLELLSSCGRRNSNCASLVDCDVCAACVVRCRFGRRRRRRQQVVIM